MVWVGNLRGDVIERKGWYYEQLGRVAEVTAQDKDRNQLSLNLETYRGCFTSELAAVLDADWVELSLRASARSYVFAFDAEGMQLKDALSGENQSAYLEVARTYKTDKGAYGRLSLGVAQFFPNNTRTLKIGLDTGVLASNQVPWSLKLHSAYFANLSMESNFIQLEAHLGHNVSDAETSELQLGLFLAWTMRVRNLGAPVGTQDTFEHMLFSFGPSLLWKTPIGDFQAQIPFRLWLDKSFDPNPDGSYQTVYPSELSVPDLTLNWRVAL